MRRSTILSVAVLVALAAGVQAQVYINEYCNDPLGASGLDTNCDGTPAGAEQSNDEFVEIVNSGASTVDISGWMVLDGASGGTVRHTFATGTMLPAGAAVVVFGGGDVTTFNTTKGCAGVVASTGSLGLNNTSDTIELRNAAGMTIDTHSYTSGGPDDGDGESVTRCPEAPGGTFTLHTLATMGVSHSAGLLKDGTTKYPPAILPAPPVAKYAGNGTDANMFVRINGTPDTPITNCHTVNVGDIISIEYDGGATQDGAPFLSVGQVHPTASLPIAGIPIPGDTQGPVIFDPMVGATVIMDGITCAGGIFCPVLGFTEINFTIPQILGQSGLSFVVIGLVQPDTSPGIVNVFTLGNMEAHQFDIN